MSKTEQAIQWMESHANDNRHGYDQRYRWGERGDYDCSSAVISAWQAAGIPVKTKGATYTGNMLSVFKSCGFSDVTRTVNLATGAGLKRGDVLLNVRHHTAMYCGGGREVEASINEKGTVTGGRPGDQTSREFLIRSTLTGTTRGQTCSASVKRSPRPSQLSRRQETSSPGSTETARQEREPSAP